MKPKFTILLFCGLTVMAILFVAAMTMPFTVRDAAELQGLSAGQAVRFRLHVTEDDSWVSRIEPRNPEETLAPTPVTQSGGLSVGERIDRA